MQTASLMKYVKPGTQIQMICIAEYNLRINVIAQFSEMNAFHTTDSAYRHKYRGLYRAMVRGE
jgi:hypothetical protein